MADVNGDGLLDIYVCRSAAKDASKRKNLLYVNNGDLTFSERAKEYGIDDSAYSTHATFFDYDNDGDLDLFVINHSTNEYSGFGKITAKLKKKHNANFGDKLFRNDNGKFINVSAEAGIITNVLGFGLGIAVSDVNNDGWMDMYISNDFNEQDYLYINNKDGTFSEQLSEYIGHVSMYSMGSDVADINNDGFTDIITLDMLPEDKKRIKMVSGPDNYDKYQRLVNSGFYNQTMRNMLQLNNGGKSFSEIGQLAGISNTEWSWSSLITDFDNDGYKDIFISNGYRRDYTNMDFMNYAVQETLNQRQGKAKTPIADLLEKIPSTIVENYMYRNNGDLTFSKKNDDWGFSQASLSNGAAYADLDNDGDMDLVVNNINEEAFVYRNNTEEKSNNHYLRVKLKGEGKNTFGIGSKIEIETNGKKMIQEMMPSRGFQSSVGYTLLFGLGKDSIINSFKITWPNKSVQILERVSVDQTITLIQEEAKEEGMGNSTTSKKYFSEITSDSIIQHQHKENTFVDFNREQLLPHMLSTQGPKICKADVNGDGLEDIFIGGAKGNVGRLFIQNKRGEFSVSGEQVFSKEKDSEDIGVLFFDADGDKDVDLYVVSGGSDFTQSDMALQDRIYFNDGKGNFERQVNNLPKMLISGSCVTAADYDKDGDLDLFVGGRFVPGQYPIAPKSHILQNNGKGIFTDITNDVNSTISEIGMVTDAIWADYNMDSEMDLIIVGEWMGVKVFSGENGKLVDVSNAAGLKNTEGWWNKISAADFDKDGDIDFVIGNFGQNSQLKTSIDEPVRIYAGDFDNNGSIDPILCSYSLGKEYPELSKDDLAGQLSSIKSKYVKYEDYANAEVSNIFGQEALNSALKLETKNFNTSYLENMGDGTFKLKKLPVVTQYAPVYGIHISDYNMDGNLDILMAGNFYGTRVKYGRYDANKGVCLLGDGRGNFSAVSSAVSGIRIDGEVRDIIDVKIASGGKLLILAKNNEAIQVYKTNAEIE